MRRLGRKTEAMGVSDCEVPLDRLRAQPDCGVCVSLVVKDLRERMCRATCWGLVNVELQTGH